MVDNWTKMFQKRLHLSVWFSLVLPSAPITQRQRDSQFPVNTEIPEWHHSNRGSPPTSWQHRQLSVCTHLQHRTRNMININMFGFCPSRGRQSQSRTQSAASTLFDYGLPGCSSFLCCADKQLQILSARERERGPGNVCLPPLTTGLTSEPEHEPSCGNVRIKRICRNFENRIYSWKTYTAVTRVWIKGRSTLYTSLCSRF